MKTNSITKRLFEILLITLATTGARANGNDSGHGGDTYAVQFVDVAKEISDSLKKHPSALVSLQHFNSAITESTVESTDQKLYLNGALKDAINYPAEKRIIFNRNAWDKISNKRTQYLLVLHEYLSLMGMDDSRYTISSRVIRESVKGSLVCLSIFHNNQNEFEISGKAVLDLNKQDRAKWDDELKHYEVSVNGAISPIFFVLGTWDSNYSNKKRVTTNLDFSNPKVDLSFDVKTGRKLNGHVVTDIEVECH